MKIKLIWALALVMCLFTTIAVAQGIATQENGRAILQFNTDNIKTGTITGTNTLVIYGNDFNGNIVVLCSDDEDDINFSMIVAIITNNIIDIVKDKDRYYLIVEEEKISIYDTLQSRVILDTETFRSVKSKSN
jgi:hypothetical protein